MAFRTLGLFVGAACIATLSIVSQPTFGNVVVTIHSLGRHADDMVADEVGHVIDVMPTCLDVAGVQYPGSFDGHKRVPLEGESLLPALESQRREHRNALFWEIGGNPAMRMGKWKLVARRGKSWELYDIEADRTEMKDLATQEPARVREMAATYEAWASRVGAAPGPMAP